MTVSKLHRKLETEGRPIFTATIDGKEFDDSTIMDIAITHGGETTGYTPATCELNVRGAIPQLLDAPVEVRLNDWFVYKIASFNPNVDAANIVRRFTGRAAITSIDDRGDKKPASTSISASSWGALVVGSKNAVPYQAGDNIGGRLSATIKHPDLADKIQVFFTPESFETVAVTEADPLKFSDAIPKYAENLGILAQQRTSGAVYLRTIPERIAEMNARNEKDPAILRSQVLAPAKWSQPISIRGTELSLKIRTSNNAGEYVQPWNIWLDPARQYVLQSAQEVDMSGMAWTREDSWRLPMNAVNYTLNYPRTVLEHVEIDMLHLFSSDRPADRETATWLMTLEENQVIYLSGDWPAAIRFPMVAVKIKHTIERDRWLLEIDLTHVRNALGIADDKIPNYRPRYWEQARLMWDEAEGAWNG